MQDPKEIELKLELQPADRPRLETLDLFQHVDPATDRLISTYFDTPDLDLHAAGFSVRVRRKTGATIQTVKADDSGAAGLFVRPEWERPIPDDTPVIDEASGPLLSLLGGRPLVPRFVSDVTRSVRTIARDGASIELAIDEGAVKVGDLSQAVCELELELKDGTPASLFAFARALNARIPLRLGVQSKSERGYELAEGRVRRAVKAEPITLSPEDDARTAFATIAQACIRQFRLNEPLLVEGGDVDAVHQARVGLRRLRSAFSLFKQLFERDLRADFLRAELKWLASELGEVRNLDVLIQRTEGRVRARLAKARLTALEKVKGELASRRTRELMIDLAEWLAIGDWRLAPHNPKLARKPILDFAADSLDVHRKRLKKRGRHLSRLDDERRHEARIEAKKLRYASEFFASLWQDKRGKRRHKAFLGALEDLQDQLGHLNDIATAPDVYGKLGIKAALPDSDEKREELLEKAETAHEALMDAKRFWK